MRHLGMEVDTDCKLLDTHPKFLDRHRITVSNKFKSLGAAAYQLGNTSSRTITEVKQR